MRATITNTKGLLLMARDSTGRDRALRVPDLLRKLDLSGNHLLTFSLVIAPGVLRTHWLVKLPKTNSPESVWMDVSQEVFVNSVTVWEGQSSLGPDEQHDA